MADLSFWYASGRASGREAKTCGRSRLLNFQESKLNIHFSRYGNSERFELRVFCPIAQNCASISSSFKYTHPRNHPISRINIRIILLVTSVLDDLHEGRTQIGDEFFRFTGTLRRHLLLYKTFAWNTSAFLNKNIYIYNIYISYYIYINTKCTFIPMEWNEGILKGAMYEHSCSSHSLCIVCVCLICCLRSSRPSSLSISIATLKEPARMETSTKPWRTKTGCAEWLCFQADKKNGKQLDRPGSVATNEAVVVANMLLSMHHHSARATPENSCLYH